VHTGISLKFVLELHGPRLVLKAGNHDRPQFDSPVPQVVDQLHGVGIVRDAEISAHLLSLNRAGMDAEEDLRLVLEMRQQPHLHIRIESRQHAGRVVVEQQLTSEFKV
jgi:hypothetical protein